MPIDIGDIEVETDESGAVVAIYVVTYDDDKPSNVYEMLTGKTTPTTTKKEN